MNFKLNQQSMQSSTHCVPYNRLPASGRCGYSRLKASGKLKTTCQAFIRDQAFIWESEAPAELGFGSAGVSPSRYKQCFRSPKSTAIALFFLAFTAFFVSFSTAKEDEPKSVKQEISTWIENLGSDDYSKRQLATLYLSRQKTNAIPFVIEAINDATGEKADRLFQFLSSIAADPYSDSGKLAFDSLNELAASRTTSKSIRAEKILQVIGADQRDAAIDLLEECKASLRDRELQVMSGKFYVKQPLVIDRKFTGNATDLGCLKWLTDVEFARLEGPQIDREILQKVLLLPHLKKLQLVETELTIEDLVVLRDAPDLDLLEIVYSPIGDDAAELLASLPVWGNIYLFGTKLTQIGQQSLKSRLDGVELFMSRGGFLGVQALGNSSVISEVVSGGAAERAGLRRGDKLLSVNGVPIHLFDDLRKQLANFADGEKVIIEFERRREIFQVPVFLGRRVDLNRDR